MPINALFLGGTSIDLVQENQHKGSAPLFMAFVGGSITNSSIIGAKLGLNAGLITKIGTDPLGDFSIRFLISCGINTKGIIRDSSIKTPIAIADINKSGNSKYTFYKNPPKDSVVPLKKIPRYLLNNCKVFHTGSSYSYQKETFKETVKFIRYLKKRDVFISYDPNIRPNSIVDKISVKNMVFSLLKLADLAKLSEIDMEYLTGQKSHLRGLEMLKKELHCEIVLTLGSKGSIYRSPRRTVVVPAFKVKIADTIGAGDAFSAGLIYQLIKQGRPKFFANMKANMIFASAVSAIVCAKKGSHQGIRNISQVEKFLKNHAGDKSQ